MLVLHGESLTPNSLTPLQRVGIRQVTPLGWDEDSLEAFPGNHMNSAEFSKWSRRMAFELGVFCRQERNRDAPDLKTLACSTDLEEALNNHRIPNPFWACIAILRKNTDYPREQIVMRAHENLKFRSVKYDPTAWVDEYLASLLQRKTSRYPPHVSLDTVRPGYSG